MEHVQRPEHARIRLPEFPQEALASIENNEGMKSAIARPLRAAQLSAQVNDEEQAHRQRFIELDGMPPHAVAEVDGPRRARRDAVSEIGQAGEETTQPANDDPHANRQHERAAG